MARACSVCTHPNRIEIDESIRKRIKSTRDIAKEYGFSQGAVQRHVQNHIEPEDIRAAALSAPAIESISEPTRTTRLNAYEDLETLREKSLALIERLEKGEGDKTASTFELAAAYKDLRENVRTMVQVYEAQKRIEAEYHPPETIEASATYRFLRDKYPGVLRELVAHLKEAR